MMSILRTAVEAFSLTSNGSFHWLGKEGHRLSPSMARGLNRDVVRAYTVQRIRNFLYTNFYIRGTPCEPRTGPREGGSAHSQFVSDILQADSGRDSWRYGGVVLQIREGRVIVSSGALRVHAKLEECHSAASPLIEGAKVRLRLGRHSLRVSPGYCMFFGERDHEGTEPILRFYWNLEPGVVADFVREATTRLNAFGLPFRLKVLADPLAYDRCDAGVLYVARSSSAAASDQVAKVYDAIGPLRDAVPALTKRLASGLAAADDPGNGESFGMHRCGVLAEALMLTVEQQLTEIDERMALVTRTFASAGIDLERPHLRPGLTEPNLGALQTQRVVAQSHSSVGTVAIQPDWLDVAAKIGARIAADAVWYRDRCQWIGAEPVPGRGWGAIDYRTLPGGLYSGTAGVGLFLAELANHTGDPDARRTALGAIRQSLSKSSTEVGLYPGTTGIALVAARIGALLREDWLSDRAEDLARQVLRRAVVPREHDLMYGAAGRIVGAFALENLLDVPAKGAADRYGQALLRSARRSAQGWSWPGQDSRWTQNLTGLSHGAAGVAYALSLLWQRTGKASYRTAAAEAIQYEQAHFSADLGNWLDLRPPPRDQKRDEARYSLYWCHGAPGIALQRLSSAALLDEPAYLEQARVAIKTTADRLATSLRRDVENYSLCHGLLGNAEILIEWASSRGEPEYQRQAEEAAIEGLRLYGASSRWPCGTIEGDTPGLMLGRAGIGYFYLRLADPKVPSVLLIDPPAWAVSTSRVN